jgi:diguanylate cyclase (GGDEF)-like protein
MGKGSRLIVDYILQLGLNKLRKSDLKDPNVQAVWLINQLLEVLTEILFDEGADGNSFHSQLEVFRRTILDSRGNEISGLTALNTLDLCRGQFKKSQARRHERDEHFAEIILFLRKALAGLTGDSRTYHEDLLGAAGRIRDLVNLKDIDELRSKVAAEVSDLNRAIVEKQKREQTQFAQLSEQVSVLQHKLEAAKAEASLDGLTGIANRRNFDFTIQRWVIAHEKSEEPFTVAIFDLDGFKQINDNYGHQVGDQVLVETAVELSRKIRSNDFLARYGGEEFVVLSAGMKLLESEKRFSEVLRQIESKRFDLKNPENESLAISLTASCGVAEYATGESPRDLIQRADEALYGAKRAGKNRVAVKRRPLLSAFYEGRKRNSIA